MNWTALIVLVAVAAIIFGPLVIIWALNTLFGLAIGYTFETWAAALILTAVVGSASRSSK